MEEVPVKFNMTVKDPSYLILAARAANSFVSAYGDIPEQKDCIYGFQGDFFYVVKRKASISVMQILESE